MNFPARPAGPVAARTFFVFAVFSAIAASAAVAGSLFAAPAAVAASAARVHPPDVPAGLEPPAGNRPFLVEHAWGTQNQICLPRATGEGLAWTFFGPQATLFDDDDHQKLTHFLSPNPEEGGVARATWQHSRDSSSVWARAIASSADPAWVEAGAVPWLLLEVVGTSDGPDGGDRMSETTYVQRVHTSGGLTPGGDCPTLGAKLFVPYEADYVFWRSR